MLLFAHITLSTITALIKLGDWIALRTEVDEDLHPFLREDYRPIQVRGRPRRLT